MNYKLEKFWNLNCSVGTKCPPLPWTINLKSFEILKNDTYQNIYKMNYKLEKFWNSNKKRGAGQNPTMNYKLEKFWNLKYSTTFSSQNSYEL